MTVRVVATVMVIIAWSCSSHGFRIIILVIVVIPFRSRPFHRNPILVSKLKLKVQFGGFFGWKFVLTVSIIQIQFNPILCICVMGSEINKILFKFWDQIIEKWVSSSVQSTNPRYDFLTWELAMLLLYICFTLLSILTVCSFLGWSVITSYFFSRWYITLLINGFRFFKFWNLQRNPTLLMLGGAVRKEMMEWFVILKILKDLTVIMNVCVC
jgi:hypothetical protein